jgi:hypothetical protein
MKGGTRSSTLAAQITRVRPHSISTEPAGKSWKLGVICTGRSWSGARPSCRLVDAIKNLLLSIRYVEELADLELILRTAKNALKASNIESAKSAW